MRRHLILAVSALAATAPVAAQDAARVEPQNYRVVVDNPQVRVLSYTGRPGTGRLRQRHALAPCPPDGAADAGQGQSQQRRQDRGS